MAILTNKSYGASGSAVSKLLPRYSRAKYFEPRPQIALSANRLFVRMAIG